MMKNVEHHDSPHDALIKALEKVEDMESVLIIYEGKKEIPSGSFDSDISLDKALWLVEIFKFWILAHTVNVTEK